MTDDATKGPFMYYAKKRGLYKNGEATAMFIIRRAEKLSNVINATKRLGVEPDEALQKELDIYRKLLDRRRALGLSDRSLRKLQQIIKSTLQNSS